MNKFVVHNFNPNKTKMIPEIGKFPGGEIRVRLPHRPEEEVRVEAILLNSDDVMTLVMLVDALREAGTRKIRLTMPYIPYARQDRVCNVGEAFSIKAFARIINSLEFSSIIVYDAHSDVSVALIDRCINVPRYELMKNDYHIANFISGSQGEPIYLVSPDAGAVKKSYDTAKVFPDFKGVIFAEKVRNPADGKILKTVVRDLPEDIANAKLLVCDDICDGGRTFTELGKVLRPYCKELNLFVTHGIFSQGMEVFEPYFDNVWSIINFKEYK